MKLNPIKIDKFHATLNILSLGYLGYIQAKEIANMECFEKVRLKGELLNIMWLVPLISSLYVLSYIGNFILNLFHGGSLIQAILDVVFVYIGATAIFQFLSTLLSIQIAKEISFESVFEKLKFVTLGLTSGVGLVEEIMNENEPLKVNTERKVQRKDIGNS